jgi:hypothetical protein
VCIRHYLTILEIQIGMKKGTKNWRYSSSVLCSIFVEPDIFPLLILTFAIDFDNFHFYQDDFLYSTCSIKTYFPRLQDKTPTNTVLLNLIDNKLQKKLSLLKLIEEINRLKVMSETPIVI